MSRLVPDDRPYDFTPLHDAMQRWVDRDILPGVSAAVLVGNELADVHYAGWADREAGTKLGEDHIFRIYSNTKLMTSMAALLLYEEGCFQFDDPVETYLPQLADRVVLPPDAAGMADAVPAATKMTVRHLLTHTAGLTLGLFPAETVAAKLHFDATLGDPNITLAEMVDRMAPLPLLYHPGATWAYSMATDVVARLVEVWSGQTFGDFLQRRIFAVAGMTDTGFYVPAGKQDRLVTLYDGADIMKPMEGGLTRMDGPYLGNDYLKPMPKQSGAGGLVSTLPDMVALLRALSDPARMILKPETMELVYANQLPAGQYINFLGMGTLTGKGHGLASAVSLAPLKGEADAIAGEFYWGGIAGTQWWVSPRHNLAGAIMTQRRMAFSHPFSRELKKAIYDAVVGA